MSETSRARLALAAVCFFWGTTYLAIHVGVSSLPPLFFCAVRFFIAGTLMLLGALLRGEPLPKGRALADLALIGFLLLSVGNGFLAWGLKRVPTGAASLIVAATPLWLAVFARLEGEAVGARAVLGLLLGFAGLAVLVFPDMRVSQPGSGFIPGVLGLLLASASWAWGSIYSKGRSPKDSPIANAAVQMLAGSLFLLAAALWHGDAARWAPSAKSWFAIAYLVVFGSIVGYSAYLYALARLPTTQAAVYAYVNPLVAMALGVLFLGERPDWHVLGALPLVLSGIYLVNTPSKPDALPA